MACTAICTIPDCGKVQKCKGFCSKHWARWSKYGHPLAGSTEKGAPAKFCQDIVKSEPTDECVIWPFGRSGTGYGACFTADGKRYVAPHRYICTLANGAPKDGEFALHSCGNGNSGCVNPAHLRWGTPSDNYHDSVAHGTAAKGEKHYKTRVSDKDFEAILASKGLESHSATAIRFGITANYVAQIRSGHARRSASLSKGGNPCR